MLTVIKHAKPIAWGMLVLLMAQTIGCATYVPLAENLPAGNEVKVDARLRVHGRDQSLYVFPPNMYTLRYEVDSTVTLVRGWGDKYTSFGLVDQGYFKLEGYRIQRVEIEKVSTSRVVLFAGAVVGLSVLTYLGVKVVGGDAGPGRGRVEAPADGN